MMGILLLVLGCSLIPALLVAFIYREPVSAKSFLAAIIPCFLLGYILMKKFRPSQMRLKARDGFLIVSLCWLLASLIGAVPLFISGAIPSYVDAFFEVCSGFSTTGSSILTDIESLPKSMLFWRSFTHWLGGMGIIVFAMALLPVHRRQRSADCKRRNPGTDFEQSFPEIFRYGKKSISGLSSSSQLSKPFCCFLAV